MDTPTIVSTTPAIMELDPGTYYGCSCGKSADQSFCNGAHQGTSFRPVAFTLDVKNRVALCTCKRAGRGPFCDGSHASL